MKNLFKISLFILALAVLPHVSSAQANHPYTIVNNLSCPVMVRWMVSCVTCPFPAVQQTNPTELIPPGTFTIPSTVFMAATNSGWTATNTEVSVQIIEIGGFPIIWPMTSPYVDSNTPVFSGTGYPGCAPPSLNLVWSSTGASIF